MKRPILFLLAAGLLLSGCMLNPQRRLEVWTAKCEGYGHVRGSAAYAQCVQLEEIMWQQRYDAAVQSLQQLGQQFSTRPAPAPPPVLEPSRSIHCITGVQGGVAYTTCN